MSSRIIVWFLLALACAGAAVFLALHHPIAPLACLLGALAAFVACLWREKLWLFLVPACLPWLNFAPWTGWVLIEEFDLLLLAVLAAGYARLAAYSVACGRFARTGRGPDLPVPADPVTSWLVAALLLSAGIGVARGLLDAGSLQFDWYQGYVDPLNTVRAVKGLVFAVLTLPLLMDAARTRNPGLGRSLLLGMVSGAGVVCTVVLWERLAYPGLLDFSVVYRVTAWFWEMHVGGAAVDAYLALASPFVLLFWVRTRTAWSRGLASILLLALVYAILVTFSRGLYAAVFVALLVFASVSLRWRSTGKHGVVARAPKKRHGALLVWRFLALPVATVGVVAWLAFGTDSFLVNRLQNTDNAWAGRQRHWANGLAMVRSPADWVFGIGLGRFPARYTSAFADGDFPGAARAAGSSRAAADTFVTLQGPRVTDERGGLFTLTQRVSPVAGARYLASGRYRAAVRSELVVQVCERHLLYNWGCQEAWFETQPGAAGWHDFSVSLQGARFAAPELLAARLAFFTISVVNAGGQADLTGLQLSSGDQAVMLLNGDFGTGLARWFPAAQYYFLPWHTDSMLLELVVERGLTGLLAVVALLVFALMAATRLRGLDRPCAACLLASLAGVLVVGAVSSVLDVPRVAFLMYFLMFFSLVMGHPATDTRHGPPGLPSVAAS